MENLCQRLNACQEKILDYYELDSNKLTDQIDYWKLVRYECAIFYKAREGNMQCINHQVVPSTVVCKQKAWQAIEIHIALQSLINTDYNTEAWTMRDTSYEMYMTEPKHCFKKEGTTVTVVFDCNKENTMDYIRWKYVYYKTDIGWCKGTGDVDAKGIYYTQGAYKQYYVDFKQEAEKYGTGVQWAVHVCGQVICCPEFVSSTCSSNQISTAKTAEPVSNATTQTTEAYVPVGTKETEAPYPGKRRRLSGPDTTVTTVTTVTTAATQPGQSVDYTNNNLHSTSGGHHPGRDTSSDQTVFIVHLKGDTNSLKCLRYRFKKHKGLYCNVSSTWHWTSNDTTQQGIVTITFNSITQRNNFLTTVKIPQSITSTLGIMSL